MEQAIKELDYHLNAYARGLKSNRTNTIAVILPTIAHPYFGLIAHCINSSLQKRGYRMLLCDTDYDNGKRAGNDPHGRAEQGGRHHCPDL